MSSNKRLSDVPEFFANLFKEMTMKLKPTLAASLFAIMAALSLNASAAADIPADATVAKAAPQKQMKPHSHVQEKTGFAQKATETVPDKANAADDKTKHFHPRDGK
jgi:hypothetical protein